MRQDLGRFRLLLLYIIPFACFAAVGTRLAYLQVVRKDHYTRHATEQQTDHITIIGARGKILDRNGYELAGAALRPTLYVAPGKLNKRPKGEPDWKHGHKPSEKAEQAATLLAKALHLDRERVLQLCTGSSDVPIARQISDEEAARVVEAVNQLGSLPRDTFYFRQDNKRFYARESIAAHVIGHTQVCDTGDNQGMAGVELYYDGELRAHTTSVLAGKNAKGGFLEPADRDAVAGTHGKTIVLTIDEGIQRAAEAALTRGVQETGADGGTAIVYAVKTGEILALASCPTFNLNQLGSSAPFQRRNRALSDAVEPGSVIKIFTYAAAFEKGGLTLTDTVNCEGGTWRYLTRTIIDSGSRLGVVPISVAFAKSSNVGAAKQAVTRLSNEDLHQQFALYGFGKRTGIDLPGESPGVLHPVKNWDSLTKSSLAFGYALQTNAVQIAAATAAIANGGIYMQPHVVKEIRDHRGEVVRRVEPKPVRRIVSEQTSQNLLKLMEAVVLDGTGKQAALENYAVAGKTGTSKKTAKEGGYAVGSYVASFAGVAPLDDPEVCIYVYVDNPGGGVGMGEDTPTGGGAVAAPVFREIAQETMRILKVPVRVPSEMIATAAGSPRETSHAVPRADAIANAVAAALTEPARPGTMPVLTGLTMREAATRLTDVGMPYRFEGSGVVIDQVPRPYETVDKRELAVITFGTVEEGERRQARAAASSRASQTVDTPLVSNQRPRVPTLLLGGNGENVTIPAASPALISPKYRSTRPEPPKPTPRPDLDPRVSPTATEKVSRDAWAAWKAEREAQLQEVAGQAAPVEVVAEPMQGQPSSPPPQSVRPAPAPSGPVESLYDIRETGGR